MIRLSLILAIIAATIAAWQAGWIGKDGAIGVLTVVLLVAAGV